MASKFVHELLCIQPIKISSNGLWTGDNPLTFSLPLLCVQLTLIMVTTNLIYVLIRPLKQPRIVAEIIGGVLLGPSGLSRNERFREAVFPNRSINMLESAALFGILYYIFLMGVRTDVAMVRKVGKKAVYLGLPSVVISFALLLASSYGLSPYLSLGLKNIFFQSVLGSVLAFTAFPVIIPILADFNLLTSEIGRIATSTAFITDLAAYASIFAFTIMSASMTSLVMGVWAAVALLSLTLFIFFIFRPFCLWVIRTTPRDEQVKETYIFAITVVVAVVGFVADLIGAHSYNGALMVGVAIPDGPPLGSAVVQRLECFINSVLLPLFYVTVGLKTDVFAIQNAAKWSAVQFLMFVGFAGKFISTLIPAVWLKIPLLDATSLSLIMCARGVIELLVYSFMFDNKFLDDQTFAIMVLSTAGVTAIVCPIFYMLYKPASRYVVYRRRTILHSKPDEEIKIVACVHNQSSVPTIINILEATNPTPTSPVVVFAIHIVKLVGRAAPILIAHRQMNPERRAPGYIGRAVTESEHIINAFNSFEHRHEGSISVHPYTAVAPYNAIHEDVCQLALTRGAVLIIFPFHKLRRVDGQIEASSGAKVMNRNILHYAPCSVGILVDRTPATSLNTLSGTFELNIAIFFFGGEDDREALAFVNRMARHNGVSITAIRFLSSSIIVVRTKEMKLDNDAFMDFRTNNVGNPKVVHREVVVADMERILDVIRGMDIDSYDLFVVGMGHEYSDLVTSNSKAGWSDSSELGVFGDILSSPDLDCTTSILVIRQQVMKVRTSTAGPVLTENVMDEEEEVVEPVINAGDQHSLRSLSPVRLSQASAPDQ